ncbi:MAG: hypothetical protein HYX34_00035 [Actinobacteria bacterium]|nr:hypothetical protein [Actinomycetota bacterium]
MTMPVRFGVVRANPNDSNRPNARLIGEFLPAEFPTPTEAPNSATSTTNPPGRSESIQ